MKSFLSFFVFILNAYGAYDVYNEKLIESCNNSNAEACLQLGTIYNYYYYNQYDPAKASEFYVKACDNGNADGCFQAGLLYEIGMGIQKDEVKANYLYRKACNGGKAYGCNQLGQTYENGIGVNEDKYKAVELYTTTCEENNTDGCLYAGKLFDNKKWEGKDHTKAIQFYIKACNLGNSYGCDLAVTFDDVWKAYNVKTEYEISEYEKLGFSPLEAIKLKKNNPNIQPEIAFRLLSLFINANDVKSIYEAIPFEDRRYPNRLDKAYFEPIIQYAKSNKIPVHDAVKWYKYINPESATEEQSMTEYYKNGFSIFIAKDYLYYRIPIEKAKQYEKQAIKECGKDWQYWGKTVDVYSNPYTLKNQCYRARDWHAESIINQSSAIYKYGNTWVKITDKNGSAKTLFSGIIKFTEPVKFVKPDGYTTMIPSAKSIVTYSWH